MAKSQSQLQPPHGQWFEDLPKAVGLEDDPFIKGSLNWISGSCLEVSRAASRQRGALLVLSSFCLGAAVFGSYLFGMFAMEFTSSDGVFMFALMPILVCLLYSMCFFGLRFELTTPRDEPIRLNRQTGKIYVSDFAFSQNPFGKWNATVREFNWADVQCELIRYAQFNSRFVVMRYGLELAICKPGTLEVVERIWLERNSSFPDLLRGKWQYLVAYMEGRPLAELPPTTLRSQTVSWRNSFDMWLPWVLDPKTYFGAHPLLFLLTIVMVPLAPFFLLAVIGNYVAMRFSPPAHWPQWVDEACGLRTDQLGDRRGMLQ